MKNLIVIGDYCSDGLTVQELRSTLLGHLSAPLSSSVSFVHSIPDTIHTAFLLKQILTTENRHGDLSNLVVFLNTDARIQTSQGVEKAKGAEFVIARMKNGSYLCGPNAGYTFSLVREEIQYLYLYPNFDKGTQFRSRELYIPVCALLMESKQDDMELTEIHQTDIPVLTGFHIGHIDNYGNIKTTIPHSYMKGKHEYGEKVLVSVNGKKQEAFYVNNMFGKEPGTLVVAPGSSGYPEDPFLEFIVWQHLPLSSARQFFPDALPGNSVAISKE